MQGDDYIASFLKLSIKHINNVIIFSHFCNFYTQILYFSFAKVIKSMLEFQLKNNTRRTDVKQKSWAGFKTFHF